MTDDQNAKKRLGDFEIIRELGRGGMGIVYEARQVSLNRRVALKVISGSLGLSSKAVLRFQREAEAAGRLHHTNIVPIYSTGDENGAHYYAMELIDGPSLHQVIRSLRSGDRTSPKVSGSTATVAVGAEQVVSTGDSVLDSSGAVETPAWVSEILGSPPLSGKSTPAPRSNAERGSTSGPSSGSHVSSSYFDTVATMIAGVSDGLDYAHENGVIHRDIKPANLLLSKDGRLSINDFGLARMLERPGMTMSGEFVGSPLYMSPEQIAAGRAPLDHRTDIYSLGATLYELITLKPPFPGKSRDEVIAQIMHKDPIPPRRRTPKVPVDLETICLKAMEKDPDRRYQTAGQLAEDLRHFVDRHVISARRVGPVERAVRWARKNKALTAMACLTLIVGVVSAVLVYRGWQSERRVLREQAMDRALTAAMCGDLSKAAAEIDKARELGANAAWELMLSGQVSLFKGDSAAAVLNLKAAVSQSPGSVMARSMLAEAFVANGEWDQGVRQFKELEKLPAETPEDHLFRGVALREVAPEEALEEISDAIGERPSFTLARVMRADARAFLGMDRGKVDYILDAIAELDVVSQDLGMNSRLSQVRLNARLAANRLLSRDKQVYKANEHLHEADSDVEYLANSPSFFYGNLSRLLYYDFQSNLDAIERVMKEAVAHGNEGFIVDPYCAAFFREKRIQEALRLLDGMPDQDDRFLIFSKIVLLMEDPSTRGRAEEICRELTQRRWGDDSGSMSVLIQFFVRGHEENAIEYARARAEEYVESKYWDIPRYNVDYLAGKITEADLIRQAGESERNQQEIHFVIGVRQLTRGNRQAARENFEKSGSSGFFHWTYPTWARAFVDRMAKDKTWPDWLPATPVDSEAK